MQQHLHKAAAYARLARRKGRQIYERVRTDAAVRDRIACVSAFAFIFTFFVGSVDAIVTGAADWNPGAEAAEMPRAYAQHVDYVLPAFSDAEAPPEEAQAIALEDYSFTTETLLGGPDTGLANDIGVEPPTNATPSKGKSAL
jgi:hypothetical protein